MSHSTWGLLVAVFAASLVEFVEALTIVLAMGATRGWRSALAGTAAAVVALAGFTAVSGYALASWLPRAALQLTVGTLLLVFGLQWLRKAVLRASGRKAMHDEGAIFERAAAEARTAGPDSRLGLDWFAVVVSFKGVFLEGVEIVFIVITFGLNAHDVPVAVAAALAAGLVVVSAGAVLHRPLTQVPENTLKYGVGLLLATFGTFWVGEGLGVFAGGDTSLEWPGSDWALLGLLAAWAVVARALVLGLRRRPPGPAVTPGNARGEQVTR